MTPRFLKFVNEFVFPHECEFTRGHHGDMNHVRWEDVEGDGGGVTKYGIDQRSHPDIDIKNLTEEQAREIYWLKYWLAAEADAMPPGWGEVLADIRINGGNGPMMAQRAINALGRIPPLALDGKIGPVSIEAMKQAGPEGLKRLLWFRDSRYRTLASKPGQIRFLQGWLNRDNDLRAYLGLTKN
jgi:lysozyme family protein